MRTGKPIKNKIAKKWIEKQKIVKESIGITAGDGTISGAPDPKKVRKIKKKLDKEREDDQYRTIDEAKQKLKLNLPADIKKIQGGSPLLGSFLDLDCTITFDTVD